jgi:hypothetical protein
MSEQDKIFLAREIVAREFSMREAQDLPLEDLFELATLLAEQVHVDDLEGR